MSNSYCPLSTHECEELFFASQRIESRCREREVSATELNARVRVYRRLVGCTFHFLGLTQCQEAELGAAWQKIIANRSTKRRTA